MEVRERVGDGGCQLKVNSRCFWNACKALSFGLLLMIVGATMATLGYYADQLSVGQELRGNVTVRVKHEARGFHLNNLSYAGPIVMGFGGFIVVAACVMTFEARDSAAKVVPSRNKYSSCHGRKLASGSVSVRGQSLRSEPRGASLRESPDRRTLTQAFLQFSKRLELERTGGEPLSKSPSAPDLQAMDKHLSPPVLGGVRRLTPGRSVRNPMQPMTALLSPHALLHRQALSVDNPDYSPYFHSDSQDGHHNRGSQASMVMDIHVSSGEGPMSVRVKDKTRRSELARRNVFTRQRQVVVDEEDLMEAAAAAVSLRREASSASPRLPSYYQHTLNYDLGQIRSRSTPHSRRQSIVNTRSRGGSSEEYPQGSPGRRASSATCSRRASMYRQESRRSSGDSRKDSRRESSDSRKDSRRPSGDSKKDSRESRKLGESRRRASYYSKSGTSSQETTSTRVASSSLPTPDDASVPSTSTATLMPPSLNIQP